MYADTPRDPRILEISGAGYFKHAFPARTRLFDTGTWWSGSPLRDPADPAGLAGLARELRGGDFDLAVCAPPAFGPLHWQTVSRFLGTRHILSNLRRPLRNFGPQLLRLYRDVPLAVVDFEDTAYIGRSNLFLMDRATLWFKRELPADEWKLFARTASATLPSKRFRRSEAFRRRLTKVRPLPLGLPRGAEAYLPPSDETVRKDIDIFFAGSVSGFPVRERGLAEIEALRAEGYVVDVPEQAMPQAEFYRRMSRAWLTLSPEGFGWDCFRHYEAAACGSAPLINRPTIRRHRPLEDGEHALFFDVEPGALAAAARAALADRERLARIAAAGRAHVMAHHTHGAILRYVIEETLAAAAPGR